MSDMSPTSASWKRTARMALDVVGLMMAWVGAQAVVDAAALDPDVIHDLGVLPLVVALKLVTMARLGVARFSWQHFSLRQANLVVVALSFSSVGIAGTTLLAQPSTDPRAILASLAVPAVDFALSVLFLLAARALRRLRVERQQERVLGAQVGRRRPVVLLHAGRVGRALEQELAGRPSLGARPVAFLDPDPRLHGDRIGSVEVVGDFSHLADLAAEYAGLEAVLTDAEASTQEMRDLVEQCDGLGIPLRVVPGIQDVIGGNVAITRLRELDIEDLLGRNPVELDVSGVAELVRGRTVLVTGAGGSIGSELCRQLALFDPGRLVMFERSEFALWSAHRDVQAQFPKAVLVPTIGDVTDAERVGDVLDAEQPVVIFHAAAHKHVTMMEHNPGEALKNNVLGTKVLVDAARDRGVPRFVLISTDKAVNPTSVMGATKRLAERYVMHVGAATGRPYLAVRFGNVLGSAGSVVPIFRDQIAKGGPLTVTDPDVTRYFMTIPEASKLVLQAASMAQQADVLMLDMGEPVRIMDLAHDMIRLSGFEPEVDIAVRFTGLAPGEKLHEELCHEAETSGPTTHPKIWLGLSPEREWPEAEEVLGRLMTTQNDLRDQILAAARGDSLLVIADLA